MIQQCDKHGSDVRNAVVLFEIDATLLLTQTCPWCREVAELQREVERFESRFPEGQAAGPPGFPPAEEARGIITVEEVLGCSACGETHNGLAFYPLLDPVRTFTHHAICPKTGAQVLLAKVDAAQAVVLIGQG